MLARWLTTILPAMSLAAALETTCIHRVAGLTGARTLDRAFRNTIDRLAVSKHTILD